MSFNRLALILSCLFSLLSLNTCKDVDALSDDANVLSFSIISHSPDDVLLGKPEISKDTIYIPLLHGKYSFPLSITTEATFPSSIDKVIGDYKKFVFEYTSTGELKVNGSLNAASFYVIAENGYAKKWYVTLREISDSDNASIRLFQINNDRTKNSLFCPKGIIDDIDTTVSLYYIYALFPQKISPRISLSEGASFTNYDGHDSLRFSSVSDKIDLKVISTSGKTRNWHVETMPAEIVTDISSLSSGEQARLSLTENEFRIYSPSTENNKIVQTNIDKEKGIITVNIANLSFPLNLQMIYGSLMNKQIVGISSEGIIPFIGIDDSGEFYLFDNLSGKARKWEVQVQSAVENVAEIYDMTIRQIVSSSGILSISADVTIDSSNDVIVIGLPSGKTEFPLNIYFDLTLSSGAEVQNLPPYLTFTSLDDLNQITVTNGSVIKDWKIKLKANSLSNDADVVSFSVNRISSDVTLAEESVRILPENGILRIMVEDASFPFFMEPKMLLSEGATSEGLDSGEILEFFSFEDVYEFEVKSASGFLKQWQVELFYAPQLKDPDFTEWQKKNDYIVPVYWACANNFAVTDGTIPANIGEEKAGVRLTTRKNTTLVKAIAAGTVFKGEFIFNIANYNDPKKMTDFGVPFTAKPIAVEVDVNYTAGPVLEYLDKSKDQFVTLSGKDKGSVWVEVLHWDGTGTYIYHAELTSSVTVLSRSEIILDDTGGWKHIRIPLNYSDPELLPTHITVVMSSSYRGDYFEGAVGSSLIARNVKLIY